VSPKHEHENLGGGGQKFKGEGNFKGALTLLKMVVNLLILVVFEDLTVKLMGWEVKKSSKFKWWGLLGPRGVRGPIDLGEGLG
jgi:hypothetical protein